MEAHTMSYCFIYSSVTDDCKTVEIKAEVPPRQLLPMVVQGLIAPKAAIPKEAAVTGTHSRQDSSTYLCN